MITIGFSGVQMIAGTHDGDEAERDMAQRIFSDWVLYGEIHITNGGGQQVTVLDPRHMTYHVEERRDDDQ